MTPDEIPTNPSVLNTTILSNFAYTDQLWVVSGLSNICTVPVVRADYQASMIRALQDKGWTCTGWSEPSQAGNRVDTQIRDRYKWRFLCPVKRVHTQAALSEWTCAG